MAIDKLPEFAKDGQKNTDDLVLTDGFPVLKKPARQWFNWLFNTLTTKINEIIDNKIDYENIVDNLTTDDATKPVSAKQAKKLQDNKLNKSSNLSDLPNVATARNNLGLGVVATENIVPISKGGTGADTPSWARGNLGLGVVATQDVVPISMGGTGAINVSGVREALGLGAVATQNTVAIANGGTGATTAAAARTNLELGTAATLNSDSFVRTGNMLYFESSQASGMYNYSPEFKPSGLSSAYDYGVVIRASHEFAGTRAEICIPHSAGVTGTLQYRAATTMTWKRVRDSVNTTVDANGFIKNASPIVELYADRIELNDEAKLQSIEFEKLGIGSYLIKGSTGLAQEGWYVEQPKDANGNVYHAVVYEQLENGDISVKTFEQKLEGTRIVADLEKPIDIKENRFISIRLNELPQDVTAPQNPNVVDNEGNPAPSKFHYLENGTWKITAEDELTLADERYAAYQASLRPLTRRQFKLTLLENGLLDQIENSISAIEDSNMRARIQIEYTEATEFHRTSDSVAYMCQLLGLTDEQVDQMWEQALTL